MAVALIDAPDRFESQLQDLPEQVTLRRTAAGVPDLTIWFVTTLKNLERRTRKLGPKAAKGGIWIAWPKKASGVVSDLSETVVRRTGLAAGLVDYKICAIDATWSGLKFSVRKPK